MGDGARPRAALLAFAVVGALTLVAAASADPPAGFADVGDPGWLADVMVAAVAVAAALGVVLVPATLLLTARRSDGGGRAPRTLKSWLIRLLVPVLLLVLAVAAVRLLRGDSTPVVPDGSVFGPAPEGSGDQGDRDEVRATNWTVVAIAAAGIVVAAGLTAASVRRRLSAAAVAAGREEPDLPAALLHAVGASLDAVDAEPDHRRAVVAAYVRMERLFAEAGLPRHASETAREHVDRALGALGASPGVVAVLSERFEAARFSLREVSQEDRAAAVEALHRLRDELAVPSPVAP